jgi:hypothetical protein
MKHLPPPLDDQGRPLATLLGLLASIVLGGVLFVGLWAGMNFAFGSALDGPIGALVMEAPCQRLANSSEPLVRYALGKGRGPLSSSVCHFASGPLLVEGATESHGFEVRELAYLLIGFAGYAVCLVAALASAFLLVRGARRLGRRILASVRVMR